LSLNTYTVSGRVTRDLELRQTPSGTSVVQFGIAHNRSYKKDDQYVEETHFFDCEAWGAFGELLARKLSKGSALTITGRMKVDQWEAQDGSKRSKVKLIVEQIEAADMYKSASESNVPAPAQEALVPAAAEDDIPF
jgi:single-strand DNA-binding protein